MAGITDLAMRILIGAEDRTGPVFKHAREGIQSISDSLARVETLAKRVLDFRLFIGWAQDAFKLSDSYASIQGRLRQVVGETGNLVAVQKQLFSISQQNATPLEDTVRLYAKSAEALKNYANGQVLAAKLTETVALSFRAQKSSAAEAASTVTQLTQAISSDAVQWEDFGNLADTNLKLVTVAAKNLGYNGIGELKQAMADGQVSGIALTEALVAGFDEIKAAAEQMPIGVAGSFTILQNALLSFVGESESAGQATRAFAAGLQLVANNITPIANAVLILAAAYAGKLVSGLAQSAQAYLVNIQLAKRKAAADAEELRITASLAAVRAKAVATMLQEAQLYARLVAGTEKEAAAKAKLAKAIAAYHAANQAANDANAAIGGNIGKTTEQLGGLAKAFQLVRNVASGLFTAGLITAGIGGLLDTFGKYNEKIRIFSFAWQAAIEKMMAAAAHFFSGDFITAESGTFDKIIDKIDRKYGDMAVASTDAAKQQAESAEKATEAQKKAAEETAKQVQAQINHYKELAKAAEDTAKQRQLAVEDTQVARIRTIETTVADTGGIDRSRERERQITQVLIDANRERSQINRDSTNERLRLIDEAHAKEVEAAKKANQSTKDIDKAWLDSKYKVLQEWQSSTRKTIDELIALEQKHKNAAIAADNEIANHKRSTEQLIKELQGKTEVNTAEDLSRLRGDAFSQKRGITDALKKGDTDAALQQAKRVEDAYTDVAQKAKAAFDQGIIDQGTLDSAIYDLKKAAQQVDAINAQQAEQQRAAAEQVGAEIVKQQFTLADVNSQMDAVIEKAKQTLLINVDKTAIDEAKAAIDAIPSEKTVTIKTVNEGGQSVTPPDQTVPGYADGVRLGGFGGGDRHPALLESGEGVLNKYGMRSLDQAFGPGFFDGLNAGGNPIELLRQQMRTLKLAGGGRISVNVPTVNMPLNASGTPINIHLPDGRSFGPFTGSSDNASGLADALHIETLKRGRRV